VRLRQHRAHLHVGEPARIGDRNLLALQVSGRLDALVGDDRRVERHGVAPDGLDPATLRSGGDHVVGARARHVERACGCTAERLHAVTLAHQLDVEPVLREEAFVPRDVEADERHLRRDQREADPDRGELGRA
jgi:hypothetical protein